VDDDAAETSRGVAGLAWVGSVTLLVVLAVAASTDSLAVWSTPEPSDQQSVPPVVDSATAPILVDPVESGETSLIGVVAIVLLALLALVLLRPSLRRSSAVDRLGQRFGWGQLATADQSPLPDVLVQDLGAEIGDARNALLGGDARNGIVACWMRLESGGLDAGLPRWAAETAEEYSSRVARATAVDAVPLDELAELYSEARFSDHELSEQHRDRASIALGRISDDLADGAQ